MDVSALLFSVAVLCLAQFAYPLQNFGSYGALLAGFSRKASTFGAEYCEGLGFATKAAGNIDSSQLKNNRVFRALQLLEKTGCSKLARHFTCSIFLPRTNGTYGAIPPCRSMCQELTKSCGAFLRIAALLSSISGISKLFIFSMQPSMY